MALTRITSELITDGTISTDDLSSTTVTSISGSSASSSFSSRVTLVEAGTTTKTLVSSSAQIASDISGSFTAGTGLDLSSGEFSVDVSDFMANGSNNRIITATGTDAQNAEANLTFDGSTLNVTGDATITGTLTAQEVHTEFESASILFTSGSTKFGDTIDDTHEVTGSMTMSGSLTVNNGALTVENITIDSSDINNATGNFTFSHNGTEKLRITSDKVMFSADAKVDANNSRDLGASGARFKDLYLAGNANVSKTGSFGKILVDGDKSSPAAPGLAFDNDTDTGLVWGGNNAIGIVTGGTRHIEVRSNGEVEFAENVGIGTTDPDGRLDVRGGNVNIDPDNQTSQAVPHSLFINKDGDPTIGFAVRGNGSGASYAMGVDDSDSDKFKISTHPTDIGTAANLVLAIDTSRNVGIGTDAPDSPLHVYASSNDLFRVQTDGVGVGDVNPGTYAQFHVRGAGDTSVTGSTFYDGYGDDNLAGNPASHTMCLQSTTTATRYMGPSLIFRTKVGTTLNTATVAGIVGSLDETPGSGVEAKGALRFFTSREYNYGPEFGTKMQEAMYIDYAGRVGIGTNNLGANLHVRTPFAGSVASVKIDGDDGTNDAGGMITLAYNTAGKWNILSRNQTSVGSAFALQIQDADGNDGVYMNQNATSFTSNSDERMKENIVELESATDKLNTLRCVNFTMKHDSSGEKRIGLIAQDVYKVYPEATTGSPDVEYSYDSTTTGSSHINAMGLQYTELVAPMIKAIQELSSQIGVLKAQISGSSDFNSLKTSVSGSN